MQEKITVNLTLPSGKQHNSLSPSEYSLIATKVRQSKPKLSPITFKLSSKLTQSLPFKTSECLEQCHPYIICDACQKSITPLYRYKCLTCPDYDLCSDCFVEKKETIRHNRKHPMIIFDQNITPQERKSMQLLESKGSLALYQSQQDYVYENVLCDVCDNKVKGLRFKCSICKDYDLCYNCYIKGKSSLSHQNDHQMIVFLKNTRTQFEIKKDLTIIDQSIRKGIFGEISTAKFKISGEVAALKVLDFLNTPKAHITFYLDYYKQEIEAYQELQNPYILKYYGHEFTQGDNEAKFFILTEYMGRGTVESCLQKQNASKFCYRIRTNWILHIIKALKYIHLKNFVHRDIKPANLHIDKNSQLKVGDFGVSKHGTGNYFELDKIIPYKWSAPEVSSSNFHDKSADIYSLGLTINFIFTEQVHKKQEDGVEFVKESKYFFPLIKNCCQNDGSKRPKISDIEKLLNQFQIYFQKTLDEQGKDYNNMNTSEKREIFDSIYEMFSLTQIWC